MEKKICDCGNEYYLGKYYGSDEKASSMCEACFHEAQLSSIKHLAGWRISKHIDMNRAEVERYGPDLLMAVQYYFDVLEETNGPGFMNRKDHVFMALKEAYGKATGQL